MKVLLDTHILLWWVLDDPKLSTAHREIISDPANEICVSSASGWEIATKHRLGKLPEAGDVPVRLSYYVRKAGFLVLEISLEHALAAGALSGEHKDPFDRMLIAQARLENLPVITVDSVFQRYGVSMS